MKGDFAIVLDGKETISFSLKNYKGGVKRPQVCSGTYNSFVMNILFESKGVGMFINPRIAIIDEILFKFLFFLNKLNESK